MLAKLAILSIGLSCHLTSSASIFANLTSDLSFVSGFMASQATSRSLDESDSALLHVRHDGAKEPLSERFWDIFALGGACMESELWSRFVPRGETIGSGLVWGKGS